MVVRNFRSRFAVSGIAAILIAVSLVPACGGGGGGSGAGGGGGPAPTFGISGFVTGLISGDAVAGVVVTLSGAASMTTATDGAGHYSFPGLANGSYVVAADLATGVVEPSGRSVTISGSSVSGQDFVAISGAIVATGIEFLPQTFSSAEQLRASVVVSGNDLFFTDSSDFPLKRQALDGSAEVPLAMRFTSADGLSLHGGSTYWIGAGNLYRTAGDGTTTRLATGNGDPTQQLTTDIVVDDSFVYWVDTVPSPNCSPPCTWIIRKLPLAGGTPVTLATVDRPVVSLESDADTLYWEEDMQEPIDPGCECGSKIRAVPKAGGTPVLLVDALLNGSAPPVPPGFTPGSWTPTGGLAVTATEVLFAVSTADAYQLRAVSKQGGPLRPIADVATPTGSARSAILDIGIAGADLYWLDLGNATLATVPVSGGTAAVVTGGLQNPGGLAVGQADLWWTEAGPFAGCCLKAEAGTVRRVPLAGGPAVTAVSGLDAPRRIAVDATGPAWVEAWRVASMALPSGPVTTLASGVESNMARIAVTPTSVYILDGGLVKTVPIAGGRVEKLVSASFGTIGDFSLREVDIAVDDANVYWSVEDVLGSPAVQRVPITGGTAVSLASGGAGNPQDCYRRLLVVQQSVYWSSGSTQHPVGCAISRVSIVGGAVTTLVDTPFMVDFTVDSSSVFFSEFLSGTVQKLPMDGGQPELVASNVAAWVLANGADRVYWLDLDKLGIGMIGKAPGTVPTDAITLPLGLDMDPFLAFEGLAVEGGALYFTETGTGSIYAIF